MFESVLCCLRCLSHKLEQEGILAKGVTDEYIFMVVKSEEISGNLLLSTTGDIFVYHWLSGLHSFVMDTYGGILLCKW